MLSREAGIGIVYALLTGAASNVMNNVGTLALLLPAALGSCRAAHVSPSRVLMPMAFASLLGGLVTMIGTPPNILLAQMRADLGGTAFAMFDFARVGLPLAVVGIAMNFGCPMACRPISPWSVSPPPCRALIVWMCTPSIAAACW